MNIRPFFWVSNIHVRPENMGFVEDRAMFKIVTTNSRLGLGVGHMTTSRLEIGHMTNSRPGVGHMTNSRLGVGHMTNNKLRVGHMTNSRLGVGHMTNSSLGGRSRDVTLKLTGTMYQSVLTVLLMVLYLKHFTYR